MSGNGDGQTVYGRLLKRAESALRYLYHVLKRFMADGCLENAGALTYTTLLAMVPLLAVVFAAFSSFEAFKEVQHQVQNFIFNNFVPQVGSVVQEHLQQFADKSRRLSVVGAVFLFVTSIMLLSTINGAFNRIWRVQRTHGLMARLPIYWVILTLTPLLLGASVVLSTYLFAFAQGVGLERVTGSLTRLAFILPLIVQIAGMFILYRFTPDYPVRWSDAMTGAVTAGIVLEIMKRGFAFYVTTFPTYQTIYGALASIPIFLIWMYLLWLIVLWGAEMTAALPEWRSGISDEEKPNRQPTDIFVAAISLLAFLLVAHRKGRGIVWNRLVRGTGLRPESLMAAAETLRRKRYMELSESNTWFLARDLDHVTLADLHRDLGLSLEGPASRIAETAWGDHVGEALRKAEKAGYEAMDMSIESLLSQADESLSPHLLEPESDDEENDDGGPTDYKGRLLALLGLAWLLGR